MYIIRIEENGKAISTEIDYSHIYQEQKVRSHFVNYTFRRKLSIIP